jgi:hypothetical protein
MPRKIKNPANVTISKDNRRNGAQLYDPKVHPFAVTFLAARGATQADIADAFGVTDRAIRKWMVVHPEFAEAFYRAAIDIFDTRVQRSLAERAVGYAVDTEDTKVIDGEIHRIPVRKYFPPDVTACIFWLTNRLPHKFKRVVETKHTEEQIRSSKVIIEEIEREILELQEKGLITLEKPKKRRKPRGDGS